MFNTNRYEELINYLLEGKLTPTTNWNKTHSINSLLLRHDIDFSIDYAYQIALIEKKLKVHSTFFFMLTSNMYNLFSLHNQKLVKDIRNMGHKVSIHFDPSVYKSLNNFKHEKNIFEKTFKSKVDIVSIHRPGLFLDNNDISMFGIPQTYQDIYFKKMKYISDSGGRDIFPMIKDYIKGKRKTGLHLLTHPIWWIEDTSSPKKIIDAWRSKYLDFITSEIKKNCKSYND